MATPATAECDAGGSKMNVPDKEDVLPSKKKPGRKKKK